LPIILNKPPPTWTTTSANKPRCLLPKEIDGQNASRPVSGSILASAKNRQSPPSHMGWVWPGRAGCSAVLVPISTPVLSSISRPALDVRRPQVRPPNRIYGFWDPISQNSFTAYSVTPQILPQHIDGVVAATVMRWCSVFSLNGWNPDADQCYSRPAHLIRTADGRRCAYYLTAGCSCSVRLAWSLPRLRPGKSGFNSTVCAHSVRQLAPSHPNYQYGVREMRLGSWPLVDGSVAFGHDRRCYEVDGLEPCA